MATHSHDHDHNHDHDGEAHDKHAGHSVAMFRNKFWLSLLMTIPVVIWSEHVQQLLGYQAPVFRSKRLAGAGEIAARRGDQNRRR